MPTPASRRVREPLHEQGLCNGYGRGKMWLLRREPDSGGLTRTGPDGAVDNERRGSVLSVRPMRALPLVIALFMLWGVAGCSNTVTEYTLDSHGGVTSVETLTPDESWKRTEDRRIEAELAGRKPEAGKTTWREYWKWSYTNIRRHPGPPAWKPTQSKNGDEMVAYIEDRRKARGLQAYD